jgi:MFS family permease
LAVLYSLALFVSAALLFVLQPMVGKSLLPLLGSTPQVWSTTVLFFQAVLLAGYAFSHFTSQRLAPRAQAVLQVVLLALALVALPVALSEDARPPDSANPIPWLLGTLLVTAGLPFFALAANSPMIQRWLSATRHRAARDPYFLFAASNGGSLLGLLAYPLAVEPLLTLDGQNDAWAWGYAISAVLVAACALALWLRPGREAKPAEQAVAQPEPERTIEWRDRLRWLALAAVPSSLMLGTTTYLTRDLTPVPLLWVIPLALYLLTFVVAFAPGVNAERVVKVSRLLFAPLAILLAYTLAVGAQSPLWALLVLHLAGMMVAALMCHARLAADRPPPSRLTEFYLWVAAGGVLGGIVNAIVSPLVLPGLIEYPAAIVAACMLRPAPPKKRPDILEFFLRDPRPTKAMDLLVPLLLGSVLAVALQLARPGDGGEISVTAKTALVGLACGLAFNLQRRPIRFGLGLAAVILVANIAVAPGERTLERDRSFFGIYKVVSTEDGRYHELYDGTTVHGLQRVGEGSREPLEYYNPIGPAGQAIDALPRATTERIGVVGLGAGAMACYRPGATTFYEIDPTVVRIARDPDLFTYLRDCPARVVLGDGRQSIEREPAGRMGLLAVDAFNSDAIPVHLLTREALELYLDRVGPSGAVMLHISNRYVRLEPVLAAAAAELGLECRAQLHEPTRDQEKRGIGISRWAVLARSAADLGGLADDPRWHTCKGDGTRVWTDDYSDLLGAMTFG